VVGAGSTYAVDATGGSADATLPTHTHTATSVVTDPSHQHSVPSGGSGASNYAALGGQAGSFSTTNNWPPTTGITVATTNANAGTSGTNANLPPYYALCYIMKT
jgi:hypothetical protein